MLLVSGDDKDATNASNDDDGDHADDVVAVRREATIKADILCSLFFISTRQSVHWEPWW